MSEFLEDPVQVDGYITDVAYPVHFHREVMPIWLVSTLQALGRCAPDIRKNYTWLELGCSSGLSVLMAAAANPLGHFIGVDFSAREIQKARRMAERARLRNVEFVCQNLQEYAKQAASKMQPDCDFIVTHGVYSWISEANQQAVRHIVAKRLKPGGVSYLAYMSHPGSVSFAAAQKLMRMVSQQVVGDSAHKAQAGMNVLKNLALHGAGYFIEHPAIQREMERAHRMDPAYMAHEFLNEEWHSLHVSDVIQDFAIAGCEYAGSASLLDNIDAVSIPSGIQPLLASMQRQGAGVAQLETARDIARNQNQRRDIYQKTGSSGNNMLSEVQHRNALLSQRVMLLPAAPQRLDVRADLVLETRIGPVKVPMLHIEPLVGALRQGSKTYAELAQLPAYVHNPGFVSQLLQVLAWNGWLHFMLPEQSEANIKQYVQESVQCLTQALDEEGITGWKLLPSIGSAVAAA